MTLLSSHEYMGGSVFIVSSQFHARREVRP